MILLDYGPAAGLLSSNNSPTPERCKVGREARREGGSSVRYATYELDIQTFPVQTKIISYHVVLTLLWSPRPIWTVRVLLESIPSGLWFYDVLTLFNRTCIYRHLGQWLVDFVIMNYLLDYNLGERRSTCLRFKRSKRGYSCFFFPVMRELALTKGPQNWS